jgi:hypothetical protein
MNGIDRSMNLWLVQALLRRGVSHIDVTDIKSIARENYTVHSLHLNSRGKKRLMKLIAERVAGGHASGISSFPVWEPPTVKQELTTAASKPIG